MPSFPRPAPALPAGLFAVALTAIAAGVALRFDVRFDTGLWEDEIIAVTHAVQPLRRFFVQVGRNDIHPPLYFLQLHFWSWVSHTDLWFVGNSIAWGLGGLASLWLALRRRTDAGLAWIATAFLAVLPAGLWMSQEVRPYAWLDVLLIWAFFWAERVFGRPAEAMSGAARAETPPSHRTRDRAVLLLLCVAIVYSHAVGFLAVALNGLFALGLLARNRAGRGVFVPWAIVYGLAGLSGLPVLASNLLHDANLPGGVSLAEFASWTSDVVTAASAPGWAYWTGMLVYAAVLAGGLAVARTRLTTACFLAAPLLVSLILALALKPIFKANFFAALLAPFLAIVLAQLCLAVRAAGRALVTGGALALLLALSVTGWAARSWSTDFRGAARDIDAARRPGDVVYAPQVSMFWGMAWYLVGPDWGSPLDVADPPSPPWRRLYDRLGPGVVAGLGLLPRMQLVTRADGLRLLIGTNARETAEHAPRVWLITYPRVDLPPGMPPDHLGALHPVRTALYSHMVLTLYE